MSGDELAIAFRLNGEAVSAEAPVRMHAADFLRHRLGWTGIHVGCEQGVCGMCTVLVDGVAIKSCLMLAVQLDGTEVTTVEALAEGDRLNAAQEAFKRYHALQCGYCTPGFLMLAESLKASERTLSRTEIREELAGVLCRCTGYENILRAVEEYLGADETRSVTVSTPRQSLIGAALPRKEDDRLLRGDGLFTDDVQLAHQLEMAVGRCPFPRAAIGTIDVSEASALPGVRHILTGPDVRAASEPLTVLRPVPGAPPLPYYALATEEAIHEGQPVVSVAAASRAIAEDALELIDIDYEPLPHVTDTLAALADDAPVLHPETLPSNLLDQQRGPRRRARRAAWPPRRSSVEGRFHVNRVSALPMEARGIVAHWRAGARMLEVHASTQTPHLIRQQLAECLPLDEGCIRVIASDVGGGFGMKLGLYPEDVLAVLHAMALRRPVKWIEDRLEFFRASTQAREAVFDVRIGAESDGRIVAITNQYTTDLGAWNSTYGSAQLSSVVFTGPYKVADAAVERRVALTNKTPIGAYRGYGQPEVNFALEVLIDRLARQLKTDPLELRRKNMLRPEDLPWTTPSRAVYDNG